MSAPVDKSIIVSEPHFIAQSIFSTSCSMEEAIELLPIFVFILTRKLRPIAIGSSSAWFMLAGIIARPRATSSLTNSGVMQKSFLNQVPGC